MMAGTDTMVRSWCANQFAARAGPADSACSLPARAAACWAAKMHLPPLAMPALLSLGALQMSCLASASASAVSAVAGAGECGGFAGPVAGKVNVACVGDSITFGAHSRGGNTTYPGQLQIMLDAKYPGINHECERPRSLRAPR